MRHLLLAALAALSFGCSSIATIEPPRVATTLKSKAAARTDASVEAVLDASVAVATADGTVVTLQAGTPITLPAGAAVTLPAGTSIEHGYGAAGAIIAWGASILLVTIGGAFAARWLYRHFTAPTPPTQE